MANPPWLPRAKRQFAQCGLKTNDVDAILRPLAVILREALIHRNECKINGCEKFRSIVADVHVMSALLIDASGAKDIDETVIWQLDWVAERLKELQESAH